MSFQISDGSGTPHATDAKDLLSKLKTFAESNGWSTLRWTTGSEYEWIAQGEGLSGTEEIFIGIKTYANADYRNWAVSCFTGYVSGNDFAAQPGASLKGLPLSDLTLPYVFVANAQRLIVVANVSSTQYESLYLGKFNPYATPGQYPYPVCVSAMLSTNSNTRFSDNTTANQMGFVGNRSQLAIRFTDGAWRTPYVWPFVGIDQESTTHTTAWGIRDNDGHYPLVPLVMMGPADIYGEFDGVYFVTGYGPNAVENTITISGTDYWVLRDVARVAYNDFVAIKLA